jgi:hypothetical protein
LVAAAEELDAGAEEAAALAAWVLAARESPLELSQPAASVKIVNTASAKRLDGKRIIADSSVKTSIILHLAPRVKLDFLTICGKQP